MSEKFEKAKKGLACCERRGYCEGHCPYYEPEKEALECMSELAHDALALISHLDERIKELSLMQTARVMTLEEIKDGESYWLSAGKEFVTRPVICVHREDDARKPYITFVWQFGTHSWNSEDYGKRWRCWTQRPTDKQRKAVKWDD